MIQRLLSMAFINLRMHRVEAVIQGDNVASVRCFGRAGYLLDARLRDAKLRDDTYIDLLVYSIMDVEWLKAHEQ